MLYQRSVPHETEKKSTDKNNQCKYEKFCDNFGPGFGFGNFLNHFNIQLDFFLSQLYEESTFEWF